MPNITMKNVDHFMKASAAWEQGDLKVAFEEFQLGAQDGDTSCQLNLGLFYDDGLYVEQDKNKALYWYRKVYKSGEASGANNIATIWRDRGQHKKALWWFHRAISLGDGDALIDVAQMYEDGVGVKKSPRNALRYYMKALEHQSITEYSLEVAEAGIERITA